MSFLPQGDQLNRAFPDLDDLLADPQAYLSDGPLAFGPRKMYRLALLFGGPGVALLASCYFYGPDPERIAMGVGLMLGGSVWLGWSLMLRGHELVMHPSGVEVTYRGDTVWAPWALFNTPGRPFVPDSDNPSAGLTVPVNPAAIPYIELRRGGMVVAQGAQVQGPQWILRNREDLVLPGRYEIAASDIGELLLVLGNRLGKQLPPGVPPLEDTPPPTEEIMEAPTGWFTIPLTRLQLPGCCARCLGPFDEKLPLPINARGDWLLAPTFGVRRMEVPIPVCTNCREIILTKRRVGLGFGMLLGCLLGMVAGALLIGFVGDGDGLAQAFGAVLGLAFGACAGSVIGSLVSHGMPVRGRRYSPSRGLVQIRCDNPEIAQRIWKAARGPQRS